MNFYKTHRVFIILILLFLNSAISFAQTKDQELKLTLREIGHHFLLQLGDSTSRVLPVKKLENRYVLQFEREFSFLPGELIFSVYEVFEKSNIKYRCLVEVEKCESHDVEHSFEINFDEENPYPACQERELPKDCYSFYFTFADSIVSTEGNVTDNPPVSNQQNDSPENAESSTDSFYVIIMLVIVIAAFIFLRVKKNQLKKHVQEDKVALKHEIIFTSELKDSDVIHIGKFQFNKKSMQLLFDSEIIELSSKETDLLMLLQTNENKTLEREHILNVVWGDEGDYVGRTLDVFISKLRKKLEADTSLKIINVRGVGYRFVIG